MKVRPSGAGLTGRVHGVPLDRAAKKSLLLRSQDGCRVLVAPTRHEPTFMSILWRKKSRICSGRQQNGGLTLSD